MVVFMLNGNENIFPNIYFQMYTDGSGVKADNSTAFSYFKKAADKVSTCRDIIFFILPKTLH